MPIAIDTAADTATDAASTALQPGTGKRQIDTADTTPSDPSTTEATVSALQWERLSGQRDVMIKAMVRVFTLLNGGVFGFTLLARAVGVWQKDYRIVDSHTLMALIGATVVQAGIAFLAITRFLFPSRQGDDAG